MESSHSWDLDRIVFIGRVWDEYMQMFHLVEADLAGRRILDCPAGACSFTAGCNERGFDVTACDIAYYHPVTILEQKGLQDLETTISNMEKAEVQKNFRWDSFKSVDDLKQARRAALRDCTADMRRNPNRYIPAVLPILPFRDEAFDLTLSAHFLFLYEDQLDYAFHVQALKELIRVTKEEIRIFPTTNFACERYGYLDQLIEEIRRLGWTAQEVRVPYEFQKNTNQMLVIRKEK